MATDDKVKVEVDAVIINHGHAALAVHGAKLHMEPQASSAAYVSSHNGAFNEKNKALLKQTKSQR
ncbi:hypothetical protein ACX1C1_08305 [Paenibacillus sp. strain BS8-2]